MTQQQDEHVAYVDCIGPHDVPEIEGCGTQGLTQGQYDRQMTNPWATWRCPCCGGEADFNDELSEKAMGITDDSFDQWPASISI